MKKMDLLLYHKEQEKFLEDLRNLGVVHITTDAEQSADSAVEQELKATVHLSNRVVAALQKVKAEKNITTAGAHHGQPFEIIRQFEIDETKKDRINQEIASLTKDREALLPWGNFDPANVKRLSDVGLEMKFYTASVRKFDSIDKSKLCIEKISVQGAFVYFVVVYKGEAPEITGADEARLPEISLKALDERIASLKKENADIDSQIEKLVGSVADIEKFRDEHLDKLKYEEARLSMKETAEGKLFKLSGWVPHTNEAKVSEFVKQYSAYAAFRDPLKDEKVPVKLKNNKFNKLFEPVLGLYSLPGYGEIDVAPFVAPFFTVFFGLCLGDLGYGLLVFLAAVAGFFFGGAKMRPLMMLGLVLGISTMAVGVLLNSFFGAELLSGENAARFALLASVKEGDFPAMSLSFVAGFLQLFVGMGLQSYMQMRDRGFFAGLQPISTILMATGAVILGAREKFLDLGIEKFAVGPWEIGPTLEAIGNYKLGSLSFGVGEILVFGGLAMLLLFNNVDKKIFMRPLTGLWALYNFLTGFLSNILSYLRLFALGLAGGLLGSAVNDIAFMFVPDGNFASIGVVAMALVMIGGHALNFGLSALGSFIHPLRLTFVEFYGAVGFQGGSKPYMPFAKIEQ
jgi:V/A-type H+-transporting ATPase subunit I